MPEPSQPSATPPAAGSPPAPAESKPAPAASEPDLTKLTADQLNKVLEHPDFFNIPRIKELREQASEAKKLKDAQDKATEQSLADQKKWEDLANKRQADNEALQTRLQESSINNALTIKLAAENVVDVDGALKLIDRSNIKVDDNGQVVGVDEALSSLKTDKAYLFTGASSGAGQPRVGNPSNPTAAPAAGSGQFKFKESQLTPQFYNEHKAEVDEAGRLGLIEPDGSPQISF